MDAKYAAGFFDADGSVGVYCYSRPKRDGLDAMPMYALRVEVSQKYSLVCEDFKKRWGGSVHGPNKREQYVWCCSARIALAFLLDIQPHVRYKRNQVDLAIEFQRAMRNWGRAGISDKAFARQQAISEELKRLKRCAPQC